MNDRSGYSQAGCGVLEPNGRDPWLFYNVIASGSSCLSFKIKDFVIQVKYKINVGWYFSV